MTLEVKLTNKLTYKLRLTPQMRLSLNLLQMPLVKLKDYVKQQAEENPILDIEETGPASKLKENPEDLNSEGYEYNPAHIDYGSNEDDEEKQNYRESLITKPPSLTDHLLNQLHLITNSDNERKIGELIIGNINDDGYLISSLEEMAEIAKTNLALVEKVLSLIQTFDPIGIGARDLRECLLLQLKAKGEEEKFLPSSTFGRQSRQALAFQIIDRHLPFLEKKRYDYIARKLKASVSKVKESMKEIANLEPKPGRSFNTERAVALAIGSQTTALWPVRLIPDAMLKKLKHGYEVVFNNWELPQITLNKKYNEMIKQKDTPSDAKEYLKERLYAARSLIDAIERRKETIKKVIEDIVYTQKDFLNNGGTHFKPMTQDEIAKRIGKHKSTVCRAVTNKYLQTPYGIIELRKFFSSGVKQENGEFFSSKAIKSRITDLITRENKKKPLGDLEIVNQLKNDRISISRRTVAKYRNQLKILSSKSRRE
jgi:RNA polymerase sigma-54 factor